jgi:hypothetical protein
MQCSANLSIVPCVVSNLAFGPFLAQLEVAEIFSDFGGMGKAAEPDCLRSVVMAHELE